jgi:hypothetical protein
MLPVYARVLTREAPKGHRRTITSCNTSARCNPASLEEMAYSRVDRPSGKSEEQSAENVADADTAAQIHRT